MSAVGGDWSSRPAVASKIDSEQPVLTKHAAEHLPAINWWCRIRCLIALPAAFDAACRTRMRLACEILSDFTYSSSV